MMEEKNGFTLIELLLVLSIVAIIILITPTVRGFNLEEVSHEQFLNVLNSDLLFTQNLSTTTEDYVRIIFSTNNYRLMDGNKLVFRRDYPKGIKIDTRSNPIISFKLTGTVDSRKSIKITTTNAVYEVVFPLGKGRINIVET